MIAADPDIELKVFFYSDFSLEGYQDSGFGKVVKWDTPLTDGYDYQFLDCWGAKQWKNVFQQPVARDVVKQLETGGFDAVWVHGWAWLCSLQVIMAADRLKIPVLLRGESNGFKERINPLKKSIKKLFLDFLFKKINAFLYVGKLNHDFYKSYGISEERLFLVPYTVDNDFFQMQSILASNSREELKRSLNLEPSRPIILYAAKLIEVKRPQDLLAAYRLLSPDGIKEPQPYLLFVGDGILRDSIEDLAKETGWQSIRFLGFRNQSEMPTMYDLCDIFILPSSFEPWGLAINEVMNAGKAVVVSDRVGCASDLIVDKQNGMIFPVGDVRALADAMRWAIANADQAGKKSLELIQSWSFQEDIKGLKSSLGIV